MQNKVLQGNVSSRYQYLIILERCVLVGSWRRCLVTRCINGTDSGPLGRQGSYILNRPLSRHNLCATNYEQRRRQGFGPILLISARRNNQFLHQHRNFWITEFLIGVPMLHCMVCYTPQDCAFNRLFE